MAWPKVEKLELPEGLEKLIRKLYESGPRSTLFSGIWATEKDFLKYESEALELLAKRVIELAKEQTPGEYILTAWANAIKPGESIGPHIHKDAAGPTPFAAIYYVASPGGSIIFDGKTYKPKTGELYFFPADLNHEVPALEGEKARLSIAFNVRAITE